MTGSELSLGIDAHGIHIASLAARFRVVTRSNTLAADRAEIQVTRNIQLVIFFAFSTGWVKSVLQRSVAYDVGPSLCLSAGSFW